MAITTYTELQTALGNWLNRSDLSARLPEFVALAEARFNRVLRAPDMITKDDSFTIDGQYEALPTGFLEARRFTILSSPVRPLEYISPEQMSEYRASKTSSAKPQWFTVVGTNFEFLPTPDSAYTGSLIYYKAITGLATTSPNWLLTSHPDIYLYGSLVAAEPYVMNDERLPLWKAQLDQALEELRVHNEGKKYGATPIAKTRSLG